MNGRWIKSQRAVTFPLQGLDPHRHTVENGNGNRSSGDPTPHASVIPEEGMAMEGDRGALAVGLSDQEESLRLASDRHSVGGAGEDSGSGDGRGLCNGVTGEGMEEGGDGADGGGEEEKGAAATGTGEAEEASQEVEQEGGGKGEGEREETVTEDIGTDLANHLPNTTPDLRQPKLYNLFATTVSQYCTGKPWD